MTDCKVAERSLGRTSWRIDDVEKEAGGNEKRKEWEGWLRDFGWARDMTDGDVKKVEDEVLGKKGKI